MKRSKRIVIELLIVLSCISVFGQEKKPVSLVFPKEIADKIRIAQSQIERKQLEIQILQQQIANSIYEAALTLSINKKDLEKLVIVTNDKGELVFITTTEKKEDKK